MATTTTTTTTTPPMPTPMPTGWTTVWTAMPQKAWAVADHLPPPAHARFADTTLRQTVRILGRAPLAEETKQGPSVCPSRGRSQLQTRRFRLRLSNTFGASDLHITTATVGVPRRPGGGDERDVDSKGDTAHGDDDGAHVSGSRFVDVDRVRPVLFSGQRSAVVPAGCLLLSDPVDVLFGEQGKPRTISTSGPATETLSITLYFADGVDVATDADAPALTTHPGSRTQSWLCQGGDQTASASLGGGHSLSSVAHWYFLAGVEECCVAGPAGGRKALVLVGDSITDGRCSTNNGNDRWPDLLWKRMEEEDDDGEKGKGWTSRYTLLNQAAGGNCVLREGTGGPALLARLDRDVLSQPGVAGVLLFAGVNDIGTTAGGDTDEAAQHDVGDQLMATFAEVAWRCRAAGLAVFIATIAPFCGPGRQESEKQPYSSPARERTRQRVNGWIRASSTAAAGGASALFDGLVDFDAVLRDPDPACAGRLLPAYDSGDYLHPNVAGFQAMAKSFPLHLLETM
ncbi:hypothetical protein HMPREF1624_07781 [Sporothrix schenckii ATCC 58251]|uniref:SGNH hydrolase-type esterase domain-containing protein n=1 Tax=Sporothrix schenckii (strain ATCC 58251 / de Perez 2211183) TaxID=1391915 RepID=U7PL94_SPOS1|nr:hypothetical protein HMPREF1624_07781 [Sporothrix schenckii ATCC 58251]